MREVGETPNVQEAAPFWMTVTGWPATVSVPVRCEVEVLAVTLNVTVPLPEPLAPPLMVSHAALLVAVHPHPPPAVTPVVEDPAAAVSVREVGDTVNEHGAENWNVFDRVERAVPPGPTAATVASYTMPGEGKAVRIDENSTTMLPFAWGVGLPNACT